MGIGRRMRLAQPVGYHKHHIRWRTRETLGVSLLSTSIIPDSNCGVVHRDPIGRSCPFGEPDLQYSPRGTTSGLQSSTFQTCAYAAAGREHSLHGTPFHALHHHHFGGQYGTSNKPLVKDGKAGAGRTKRLSIRRLSRWRG